MSAGTSAREPSIPETVGPYRVLGVLGRGGMGVVYRAAHVDSGEIVALKTVKDDTSPRISHRVLASLRVEIVALQKVAHPGVVRILDQGLSGGLPWYAMEFLEGRTLGEYKHEIWGLTRRSSETGSLPSTLISATPPGAELPVHRASGAGLAAEPAMPDRNAGVRLASGKLADVAAIFRSVCGALSHIHRCGLVHRDLKPANIIIRTDGEPVLMDFGLASRAEGGLGREALQFQVLGRALGSLPYISPEQIRGELVDARADLYSLGCVLFELLTGRPPFVGPDQNRLIWEHLEREPPRLSALVGDVPPALEALVARLLQKSPHERLGFADDVDAVLAEWAEDGKRQHTPPPATGPWEYLFKPRLVGRTDVLARVGQVLDGTAGGSGGLVLLGGESGIGKTFLGSHIAEQAAARGFTVMTGECSLHRGDEASGPMTTALGPFRRLLQFVADRCRTGGVETTELLLGQDAKLISAYEPSLAHVIEEQRHRNAAVEPVPARTGAFRQRLARVLQTTLAALSTESPLLLVIDDLQWADELSLSFLLSLDEEYLSQHRLLILGIYRSDETSAPLQRLLAGNAVVSLNLTNLDELAIGRMAADMLGMESPPGDLVRFLWKRSEGTPFFAAEYLRAAVSAGIFRRSKGHWVVSDGHASDQVSYESIALPSTVEALIARRISDLGVEVRTVLELAAAVGPEFDTDFLGAVAGDQDAVISAVSVLERRHIVERSSRGRCRFVHERLREVAYRDTPEDRKRITHQIIAEELGQRSLRQSEDPELYAQLAHHWARVGDPDKSAGYYLEAGRQARKRHAHEDAIKFLRAALDQRTGAGQDGPGDAQGADLRAEINENLGDLLALSGSHAEAEEAFRSAIASVPRSDTLRRAQIWRKVGKTWSERNVQKQALASYDEAAAELGIPSEDSVNSSMEWQEWVEIHNERVWSLYWMGQVDELVSNVGQLASVVERRGSPLQRAKFHLGLCITELRRQRYRMSAAAVAHARAALLAAEASAEASEVVATRLNLSIVLMFSGALDEAETLLERALEKAERVGDQVQRARVTAYLSTVLRMQGQTVRARMFARKAIEISSRAQKPHYVAIGHANLGWAHWRAGESAAHAHLSEALALWAREKDVYPFQWLALWPVLAVHARGGDRALARDALEALLDAQQQRLPADLEEEVLQLAGGTDCPDDVWIARLRSVLESAEQNQLL